MKRATPKLTTVELFCGIGGFRRACDRLGLRTLWANDAAPPACAIYRANFGGAELHPGDIRECRAGIPPHDLLTAGFPCQPFSSAGKKQGIRDARGTLFEEIVNVLREKSPRYFVLENVKRLLAMEHGDHFATILAALSRLDYFIEWRLLNATHFGLPQNRQRVFIIGTKIAALQDARIKLASAVDLHESGTDIPVCPKAPMPKAVAQAPSPVRRIIPAPLFERKKTADGECPASTAVNLTSTTHAHAAWLSLEHHRQKFPNWGVAWRGKYCASNLEHFAAANAPPRLADFLEAEVDEQFYMDATTRERIGRSVYVDKLVDGVRILYNQNGGARMGYTVFGIDGVAPALTASHSRHYERYKIGKRFRRLTNTEYARLQGFPPQHCAAASVFDQYALYGNAAPPPMAQWAIAQLTSDTGLPLGTRVDLTAASC